MLSTSCRRILPPSPPAFTAAANTMWGLIISCNNFHKKKVVLSMFVHLKISFFLKNNSFEK
jgi:hypothetical protein